MGNPRRDAFEYGVLITLTTSMAAAYALLLAYASSTPSEGQRRKIPKVELDEKVDLGKAWEELKTNINSMRWGDRQSSFSDSNSSPASNSSPEALNAGNGDGSGNSREQSK